MSETTIATRGAPASEFRADFLQKMVNAMGVSFYKYGAVADAYPHRVNALDSLQKRIEKYLETGNTEYLVDVANFAMIEFMHPALPNAFYKATDVDGSPGRSHRVSGDTAQMRNTDIAIDVALRPAANAVEMCVDCRHPIHPNSDCRKSVVVDGDFVPCPCRPSSPSESKEDV